MDKHKEFWILYNHSYNVDSVVSMKPNLKSNRFVKISEAKHVIEYTALEQERSKSIELIEGIERHCGRDIEITAGALKYSILAEIKKYKEAARY